MIVLNFDKKQRSFVARLILCLSPRSATSPDPSHPRLPPHLHLFPASFRWGCPVRRAQKSRPESPPGRSLSHSLESDQNQADQDQDHADQELLTFFQPSFPQKLKLSTCPSTGGAGHQSMRLVEPAAMQLLKFTIESRTRRHQTHAAQCRRSQRR